MLLGLYVVLGWVTVSGFNSLLFFTLLSNLPTAPLHRVPCLLPSETVLFASCFCAFFTDTIVFLLESFVEDLIPVLYSFKQQLGGTTRITLK